MNDRSQAAQLPSDEDARFRMLVDAVTDYAIFLLDPAGIVSSWNRGAQRSKGYERHEIIGRNFSEFYPEEDRQAGLPQRALATAEREGRFEAEGWRIRKDGTRFWAHVIIDPVRGPDERLVGFAKITRDLTERKQAQDALRESEERFRLLVQGVTDYAIYMLDPTGHVSNWNPGANRIKGYTADEIVGQHFSRFYTPEDRVAGEPERALATASREGRFEKEGWRVRKDGTRFWAHVIIDPIRNELGELLGFAKITRDITERRDAQIVLEKSREAFFQSQKMEALGQLTGGIAHDFNNLLTAVLGSLEMLRKRLPDDPKLIQLADNAIQGAERGAVLTQRMLAFARRQDLQSEPLDVADLVRGLGDLLQRTLGPSITVNMHLQDAVRPALADANQLELAVLNLAVNSRDAMPKGGTITISVTEKTIASAEGRLAPGRYVLLAVADTGEGMDEETLARATEPFFTTKGVGRGTGLGLSTVHGLAEQLSGALRLRSRKGEGTTAELWLPIAEGEVATLPPRTRPTGEPAIEPSDSHSLVVLAVDDDGLVLMNTSAMLEELGHKVLEASSGAQAMAILRDPAIDLVITDYAMPGMTGSDLVEAVRAERPGLPIILATGYAELPSGTEVDALRLPKPFGQHELRRVIAAAMRKREPVGA